MTGDWGDYYFSKTFSVSDRAVPAELLLLSLQGIRWGLGGRALTTKKPYESKFLLSKYNPHSRRVSSRSNPGDTWQLAGCCQLLPSIKSSKFTPNIKAGDKNSN